MHGLLIEIHKSYQGISEKLSFGFMESNGGVWPTPPPGIKKHEPCPESKDFLKMLERSSGSIKTVSELLVHKYF